MKIYNGTAHAVNFYYAEQCDNSDPRKPIVKEGEQPYFTIPAGTNLNCQKENAPAPSGEFPFAVTGAVKFTSHDAIPDGYDLIVVSNLFRSAVLQLGGDTSRLATVDGVVYTDVIHKLLDNDDNFLSFLATNPRPCGCLALAVG